jgi:hypothetical protein
MFSFLVASIILLAGTLLFVGHLNGLDTSCSDAFPCFDAVCSNACLPGHLVAWTFHHFGTCFTVVLLQDAFCSPATCLNPWWIGHLNDCTHTSTLGPCWMFGCSLPHLHGRSNPWMFPCAVVQERSPLVVSHFIEKCWLCCKGQDPTQCVC